MCNLDQILVCTSELEFYSSIVTSTTVKRLALIAANFFDHKILIYFIYSLHFSLGFKIV